MKWDLAYSFSPRANGRKVQMFLSPATKGDQLPEVKRTKPRFVWLHLMLPLLCMHPASSDTGRLEHSTDPTKTCLICTVVSPTRCQTPLSLSEAHGELSTTSSSPRNQPQMRGGTWISPGQLGACPFSLAGPWGCVLSGAGGSHTFLYVGGKL